MTIGESDYNRGQLDGEFRATLKEHNSRIGSLESSIPRVEASISAVSQGISRLENSIAADRATQRAAAEALAQKKKEEDEEHERAIQEAASKWTPANVIITAILSVGAIGSLIIQILQLHG